MGKDALFYTEWRRPAKLLWKPTLSAETLEGTLLEIRRVNRNAAFVAVRTQGAKEPTILTPPDDVVAALLWIPPHTPVKFHVKHCNTPDESWQLWVAFGDR